MSLWQVERTTEAVRGEAKNNALSFHWNRSKEPEWYLLKPANNNKTQNVIPIQTKIIGEDSLAACAPICWLTAKRQHCLFNMRRVRGHCIAFVRSAVEVMLSSGPSCCRQLGHATYIESNYPCQLITTQLVPSHNTPKRTHAHTHNTMHSCIHTCTFTCRPSGFKEGRNSK